MSPARAGPRADPAPPAAREPAPPSHDQAVRLYGQALDTLRRNYITPPDELALTASALKQLLSGLDGHSSYMTAPEYRAFEDAAKASFGGIGVVIEVSQGRVRVMSPVDGGPALRAGVVTDWEIVSIDGASTQDLTLDGVSRKLKGEPGTDVAVTFKDWAGRLVPLTLRREIIHADSVYQRQIGTIGYIRISGFNQVGASDFATAVRALIASGPLTGLVLDLRNNGGGFVDAATAIAGRFLAAGTVVVRTGKTVATATPILAAGGAPPLTALPLVVLINGGSASAAEIVAAALHDNHRAILVGQTSFGKGLVQTIFPLDGGAAGAVSVTTARYYTPTGSSIHKVGVVPDLMVARTAREAQDAVTRGADYSEAAITQALANDLGGTRARIDAIEGPAQPVPAPPDRPLFVRSVPDDADIAADFQLQRALDVLRLGSVAAARRERPATLYRRPAVPTPAGTTP